jgi:hypothetical protein
MVSIIMRMIEVKWNKYLEEFQSKKDAHNGDRLYLKTIIQLLD